MRAFFAAAISAALVFAAIPAGAAEFQPPGQEWQTESGSIALPTRFTDATGGWPGLVRRVYQASAGTNGVIGYVFDIDPDTWGGAFVLGDVVDQTGAGNLDVFFYSKMGDAGGTDAPTTVGEYQTANKGEVGFVPEGATKAVVFTPDAINATFNYAGYTVPNLTIGSGAADLTVPAGATVTWTNKTADYSFVRHTPASGPVLFDSSPKQGTGIRVGDTYSRIFDAPGTYPYATSVGTGTITVTDGPGVGTPTG
jgi:plastocyanin